MAALLAAALLVALYALAVASPVCLLALAKRFGGVADHFSVVQSDGKVFGVGANSQGQLGTGNTIDADFPVFMLNANNAVDTCAGVSHVCIVSSSSSSAAERKAECTGAFISELNISTLITPAGLESGVEEIFCGHYASYAVMGGTGQVYAWGQNSGNQLGLAHKTDVWAPTLLTALDGVNVTQVAGGGLHVCFLSATGQTVHCSGSNAYGQLGIGTQGEHLPMATVILLAADQGAVFTAISAGAEHVCAVATDGRLFAWGRNNFVQAGRSAGTFRVQNPRPVSFSVSGAQAVFAGAHNTFAILEADHSALVFGRDSYGQLAQGSTATTRTSALQFGGASSPVTGIAEIRGGWRTTCILMHSGEIKCVGSNTAGQFGVGLGVPSSLTLVSMVLPTSSPSASPASSTPTNQPTPQPTDAVPATTASPSSTTSSGGGTGDDDDNENEEEEDDDDDDDVSVDNVGVIVGAVVGSLLCCLLWLLLLLLLLAKRRKRKEEDGKQDDLNQPETALSAQPPV